MTPFRASYFYVSLTWEPGEGIADTLGNIVSSALSFLLLSVCFAFLCFTSLFAKGEEGDASSVWLTNICHPTSFQVFSFFSFLFFFATTKCYGRKFIKISNRLTLTKERRKDRERGQPSGDYTARLRGPVYGRAAHPCPRRWEHFGIQSSGFTLEVTAVLEPPCSENQHSSFLFTEVSF